MTETEEIGMTTAARIEKVCDDLKAMLLAKNAAYGDSATSPLRIFSKADHLEGIRVRVDDKLSRLSRGTPYPGDNDVLDLVGYLILFLSMQEEDTDAPDEAPWGTVIDKDNDTWNLQHDGLYMMPHNTTLRLTKAQLELKYGPIRPIAA